MLTPCEITVKYVLPALRSNIARKLASQGYTQEEIASRLGLTQAAVSKYLSGNVTPRIKELQNKRGIVKAGEKVADEIMEEGLESRGVTQSICQKCQDFRQELFSQEFDYVCPSVRT